jgi:hypothetical protein
MGMESIDPVGRGLKAPAAAASPAPAVRLAGNEGRDAGKPQTIFRRAQAGSGI